MLEAQTEGKEKPMKEEISPEAKTLAADLDKAPTGETIIQNLLHAQVALQRENAEIRLRQDQFSEGMRLLTDLVDRNRLAIEQLSRPQGGIVH
jgi:hypothetical protein